MLKALVLGMLLTILPIRIGELSAHIEWAKDALPRYTAYDEFVADTTEHQVRVLISVDNPVKQFKVLSIAFTGATPEGKMTFTEKAIYIQAALTPKRPFVLTMTFLGDIPGYGISYVDDKNVTQKFAIQQSGNDGSLGLGKI